MANKFGARKTVVDGMRFDSMAEARRYRELRMMEKAHLIDGLEMQPPFPITVNGRYICLYKADFRYRDRETGEWVVEDVKSEATRRISTYRIKTKLVEAVHGVKVREVLA